MNTKNDIFKEETLECKCGNTFTKVYYKDKDIECPKCGASEGFTYIKGFLRARYPELRVDDFSRIPTYNLCTLEKYHVAKNPEEFGGGKYLEVLAAKNKLLIRGKRPEKKLTEADSHTVNEVICKYLEEILPYKKEKTQIVFTQHLKYWVKELGQLRLSELTPMRIQTSRDKLESKDRSNSTLNRYVAALSAVLGCCVKDYFYMDENPCGKIRRKPEPSGKTRFLTLSEKDALLAECDGDLHDAVMLALLTGARQMEIWKLRFESVKWKQGFILLLETKNGKPRSIPMSPSVKEILKKRLTSMGLESPYVFPSPRKKGMPNNFKKGFEAAVKRSGIPRITWHGLRHTSASYLVMGGVSLRSVADLLGHTGKSAMQMVFRYAHLSPSHLQSAVEVLEDELQTKSKKSVVNL